MKTVIQETPRFWKKYIRLSATVLYLAVGSNIYAGFQPFAIMMQNDGIYR